MPVFTYKCPACSGPLKFQPESGKFKCEYCDNTYEKSYLDTLDDNAYDNLKEADKAEDFGRADQGAQNVYSCPSCGAEIVTDATTAATLCYYCQNPVVLTGRLAADAKPDALLPFSLDKKQAKEKFFGWLKKKKYLPIGFVSEENLESATGVYYPYWLADYKTRGHFSGEGRIVTHSSTATHNITTTKIYSITRDGEIEFKNIERGALKKADRKLSDGVHPYDTGALADFEPSYLAGFMAEKRDVDSDEVKPSVEGEIKNYMQPLLTAGTNYTTVSGSTVTEFVGDRFRYTLLPAWVLTYKGKGSKIFHFSMNGQTGRVCGILPVNINKLLIHCGILAGALLAAGLAVSYFFIN